ncbi:MAG: hypothetical protein ACTSYL_00955 [Candidatus Thorarchaeota archaeon]
MLLADVIVQCRLFRDDSWTPLGECRVRLQQDSLSLEVHEPQGPYCIDMTFERIHVEIESASTGPLLFITINMRDVTVVVEVRGGRSQVNALAEAVLNLEELV